MVPAAVPSALSYHAERSAAARACGLLHMKRCQGAIILVFNITRYLNAEDSAMAKNQERTRLPPSPLLCSRNTLANGLGTEEALGVLRAAISLRVS